jgi:hypothetical protein
LHFPHPGASWRKTPRSWICRNLSQGFANGRIKVFEDLLTGIHLLKILELTLHIRVRPWVDVDVHADSPDVNAPRTPPN